MIASCPAVPTGPGFLAGILRAMDCLAMGAAEQSFEFLATPGGIASTILVTAITLMIVILGFRLMFGLPTGFGDVTASAIKIGIALTIATSWPAISRVVAGPVINGPAELTRWTGIGSQLPERLGRADEGIGALTSWGTGRNDIQAQRTSSGDYAANQAGTVSLTDALAFGGGRTAFLVGTISTLGLLKFLAGVLVGLAPIFAGALLFERTQGLFAGWIRALFGLLIAGAAANILMAVQLSILEPWLAQAIADRQASLATPSAAGELLAMTLAFSLIATGTILVILRTVLSLEVSVPRLVVEIGDKVREGLATPTSRQAATSISVANAHSSRSARTIEALQRIDTFRHNSRNSGVTGAMSGMVSDGPQRSFGQFATASATRQPRRTLVGQRRDRRA